MDIQNKNIKKICIERTTALSNMNVFLTRNVNDKIMKMFFKTKWNQVFPKNASWIGQIIFKL